MLHSCLTCWISCILSSFFWAFCLHFDLCAPLESCIEIYSSLFFFGLLKWPQISTVIIKVDLDCCCCTKKIKKSLCKLEKRFNIQSIVYDTKSNTVAVSGPFNPDCFIKKICCLACKVIKDIHVKKPDPPPPPPPAPEPKPEPAPPPPEPAPPAPEPPPPAPEPPPPAPEPPAPPAPEPAPPPPPAPEPPPPAPQEPPPPPEVVWKLPVWPFPAPVWPVCCHQPCPCYEPRHGCCRCCSCGRVSEAAPPPVEVPPPPAPAPVYYGGRPCYEAEGCYKIVYEDEPSGCKIM
ncbi:hypothetical protein Cni_G08402 [Canna indica]|uniref:Uncharacterized protein n=1 Tax=Canna indica TaxID=4628 RepID=A0AAQ3Q5Q7_9LILI|nr:hypothetical protein Cni_G08402 [Canna indica]